MRLKTPSTILIIINSNTSLHSGTRSELVSAKVDALERAEDDLPAHCGRGTL